MVALTKAANNGQLKCISDLNRLFKKGKPINAKPIAIAVPAKVMMVVSVMNCQNNCRGKLPSTLRTPISFERLSACAVARLTKFTQAVMIRKSPINIKSGDVNYVSTFGLKILAGRNLFPGDTTREFLVNESFAKKLGLKAADVIGKKLSINGRHNSGPIVGVVNDFYNYSFHSEFDQICISTNANDYARLAIKINMGTAKTSLASFEKIWNSMYPEELYSYQFVDDMIAKFYENDATLLTLIEAFAAIAILIGCLGLYGLVSFMAVRKTKEVGVRKVLGASIQSILWLFGKEFCKLLIIAFLIAAPLAWWVMNNYLKDFVYKISIGPSIFLMAIASTFIVAAITVGYRATMAALTTPVKSLRSE